MRFLSLFSGIEATSVAWEPLGWTCVGVSEIKPFPCAVLKHRYPEVPNLGSVKDIDKKKLEQLGPIDLIVAGSPCQDISLSGTRKGLSGEKSSLFFEAIRIIRIARRINGCRFALWENVCGAFQSNEGRDFTRVVNEMAGCDFSEPPVGGWKKEGACLGEDGMLEWSVLDARWFGVASRRRRVFALADFGDWGNRPPVLLEPSGLRGSVGGFEKKRKADAKLAANLVPRASWGIDSERNTNYELVGTLKSRGKAEMVAVTGDGNMNIRKLTPVEKERLLGFPDKWTEIPNPKCSDAARSAALGNSMAVPVMRWIGKQIQGAI